ncbi:MAG: four helix bundle protein [Dehalococcoidia bacterium]
MAQFQSYRDLIAWQKAMDLAGITYDLADKLPRREMFGMTSQLRNASSSIPANIAEGHGRLHTGDFRRHLSIALGSLAEAETFMLLAVRRRYLTDAEIKPVWDLAQEVGRLIRGLARSLESREGVGTRRTKSSL